jgi:hypothetical protein
MNRISGGFEADRGQGEKRGVEKKEKDISKKKEALVKEEEEAQLRLRSRQRTGRKKGK